MRVVFITRESYHLSGARVRCYNFAQELKRRGVDASVFSFSDNLGAKCGDQECTMRLSEKLRYLKRSFGDFWAREKNSIICMQRFNYHSPGFVLLSLLNRNKLIFDCDDWNIREDPRYYLGMFPSSKMEFLTRKTAACAHACIGASRYLQEYLSMYNKKTYYLPTVADTDFFRPGNGAPVRDNTVTLGWVGTVYHPDMYHNLKFMISAFEKASQGRANIRLKLAGEGLYYDRIRDEIKSGCCKDKIEASGWIEPDRMPAYLGDIDIGLMALIQPTRFNIAKSPTKLFEYMAMAKPVVCSRAGEAASIIEDGVNGFLADTRDEFAAKMRLLIDDASLRRRMGAAARNRVEDKYSLKISGKILFDILQSIQQA